VESSVSFSVDSSDASLSFELVSESISADSKCLQNEQQGRQQNFDRFPWQRYLA
jgi:hypothetical protein